MVKRSSVPLLVIPKQVKIKNSQPKIDNDILKVYPTVTGAKMRVERENGVETPWFVNKHAEIKRKMAEYGIW